MIVMCTQGWEILNIEETERPKYKEVLRRRVAEMERQSPLSVKWETELALDTENGLEVWREWELYEEGGGIQQDFNQKSPLNDLK